VKKRIFAEMNGRIVCKNFVYSSFTHDLDRIESQKRMTISRSDKSNSKEGTGLLDNQFSN